MNRWLPARKWLAQAMKVSVPSIRTIRRQAPHKRASENACPEYRDWICADKRPKEFSLVKTSCIDMRTPYTKSLPITWCQFRKGELTGACQETLLHTAHATVPTFQCWTLIRKKDPPAATWATTHQPSATIMGAIERIMEENVIIKKY